MFCLSVYASRACQVPVESRRGHWMLSVTGIAGRQLGAGNLGPLEEQLENGRKVVLAKAGPVLPPILSEALRRH